MKTANDLSSGSPSDEEFQIQQIVEWWNALRTGDETGAATWEVLESLERQVTECLAERNRNVAQAISLTAFAMLLVAGDTGF